MLWILAGVLGVVLLAFAVGSLLPAHYTTAERAVLLVDAVPHPMIRREEIERRLTQWRR